MRQVHIRVDDELYNELNSYSEKNELSMQDCVREAVAYYMSDVKKKKRFFGAGRNSPPAVYFLLEKEVRDPQQCG